MFIWGRFWGDNGFFDLSGTALSLFQGISVGANSVGGGELFELNSNKDNAIGIFNSRFNSHTNCYHIKLTYNSSSGELASSVFKGKGAATDASGNTVNITISSSAPSTPSTGDIWIDIS